MAEDLVLIRSLAAEDLDAEADRSEAAESPFLAAARIAESLFVQAFPCVVLDAELPYGWVHRVEPLAVSSLVHDGPADRPEVFYLSPAEYQAVSFRAGSMISADVPLHLYFWAGDHHPREAPEFDQAH